MRPLKALWTLLRVLTHIAVGLGMELACRLRWGRQWFLQVRGKREVQRWKQKLLKILHIEVEVRGQLPGQAVLLVANHMTWLDIMVLGSVQPYHFLSKSEVSHWPLIGGLVAMSGTLFIDRSNRRSMRHSLKAIIKRLQRGHSVVIFPEGTTRACGLNPFKTGLFASAGDAPVKVQPVLIEYCYRGQPDTSIAYVDDDNFFINLMQQAAKDKIHVRLHYLPVIEPHHDRRVLAQRAREAILAQMERMDDKSEGKKLGIADEPYLHRTMP
ncbi:MAG: 1-acyl-sn-glycerol-3-phosphate acyltransferase [Gammaproteobacteria bacterium]|nr:1-acyl-sn-glycerol-3-phosphate acyltransferase [Gammaproteobacteria bacterium]